MLHRIFLHSSQSTYCKYCSMSCSCRRLGQNACTCTTRRTQPNMFHTPSAWEDPLVFKVSLNRRTILTERLLRSPSNRLRHLELEEAYYWWPPERTKRRTLWFNTSPCEAWVPSGGSREPREWSQSWSTSSKSFSSKWTVWSSGTLMCCLLH